MFMSTAAVCGPMALPHPLLIALVTVDTWTMLVIGFVGMAAVLVVLWWFVLNPMLTKE
jgi:hypothetical protein